MVYIKKMVMHGFKSFARRTEVVFDKGVNVVLGPNGSGKSNLSDSLCFVLGRLSIKSMRAAKAKNLLFMGSKYIKPAKEASVEIVFDNSDRAFSIDRDEIHIMRVVRHNGQSIYKINEETKTRAEVIEMLAQAGIDPHGFNLILQGQIQSVVRMHPEERRKIIEEVAGISIYESRKEKSLHELEKTDERLKEISAILRERTSYLRNLDNERSQALRFKELEITLKRLKASIIQKKIDDKQRELASVIKSIEEKSESRTRERENHDKLQKEIENLQNSIQQINRNIQQATGLEQEKLHTSIGNLKAELEGYKVRKENYENRMAETERRIAEMRKSIPEIEAEIRDLKKESPIVAKKSQELKRKKDELAKIEEERNKMLGARTERYSIREIMKDKEKQLNKAVSDSETLLKYLENISANLRYKSEGECLDDLNKNKKLIREREEMIDKLQKDELKFEKILSLSENDILRQEKITNDIKKIDICPLCQSKITEEHVAHVFSDAEKKIKDAKNELQKAIAELSGIRQEKEKNIREIRESRESILYLESELIKHRLIREKKEQVKKSVEYENYLKQEIKKLEERENALEARTIDFSKIQEKYDSKILEIEEISSRTADDLDTSLLYKERELENINNIIKSSSNDFKEISRNINNISSEIESKLKLLAEKEKQERELNERFKKMFEQRDASQMEIQEKSISLSEMQSSMREIEEQINYLKIGKAKIDAEKEAFEMEIKDFIGLDIIKSKFEILQERLVKTQEALQQIGSINMRALEVYDSVKKEYDEVQEKVNILEKEKIEIMKIIEEIDKKKTRSFMKNFKSMNELFTQNFSKLSSKGTAFLELENKEDIFSGGVNIVVKLAKGKYFDVTSLSGGEQTLVALSLLFAIQEYKPYHFYIFDEIDAALDKRNSERLAGLLKQYMKAGQYIIITHNDAIIMESNVLYGVSMHEGVSKILSLKLNEEIPEELLNPFQQKSESPDSGNIN